MTSVLPAPSTVGATTGPWVRVSVLTPRGRADLALPADVPVAELVPMVRELLGRDPAAQRPQAWRFTGPAGGPLPPDATLDELRVRDGELLRLGPTEPAPAPPVLDDAAEAVARAVRDVSDGSAAAPWAGPAAAVLGVAAACLVLSTVDGPLRWLAAAVAAAGTVAALVLAHRAPGTDARTAAGAALCAVPPAATVGPLLLPASFGAGGLLLAVAGAGLAAAAGQAVRRSVSPLLLAVALAATVTAPAVLFHVLLDAPAAAVAVGLAAPALAAGPLLPRIAVRLAGVPAPAVPSDAGGLPDAERLLPGDTLAVRARLARGLYSGTLAGTALPAAGGAATAAATGGWTGALLLVVTAAVLLLRARALADPIAARVLTGTAVVAVAVAAVPAALALGPGLRVAVGCGLLLAVAGAAAAVRTTPSPPARRALDITELILTAATIPAALAAMGLFGLVRGL